MKLETHEFWINKARELSYCSLPQDVPVGALIINHSGEIIAEGWNQREGNYDSTAHAEIIALRKACEHLKNWRLSECVIYVTLEPCPMCASAILQSRVSTIVFGTIDPIQGALGTVLNLKNYYSSPVNIIKGIQETACQEDLQKFFRSIR